MKRRHFIGMAIAGAAGLVRPAARAGKPLGFASLAEPDLLKILRDEHVVCELGELYRETVPAEDDSNVLAEAILGGSHSTAPLALRARLSDEIRRDFASGRTVTLKGWILSLTEARQCALYSLLQA